MCVNPSRTHKTTNVATHTRTHIYVFLIQNCLHPTRIPIHTHPTTHTLSPHCLPPPPTPSPCITLSFTSASAPRFSSSRTTCRCPCVAARINAVQPRCIQGGEHSQEEGEGNGASPLVQRMRGWEVGRSMVCVCMCMCVCVCVCVCLCVCVRVCVCVCVCVVCVLCLVWSPQKMHRTNHHPVFNLYHPSHHYAHTKPNV